MSTFLQLTFAGLNVGALYALIAVGMVVTYQVARVESLAQGVFVVYGALTFVTCHDVLGLPLVVAVAASIAVCAVIAVVLWLLATNRYAARSTTGPVLMLLAAALLCSELAKVFWGLDDRGAQPWLGDEPLDVLGATVLPHSLLVWAGTAVLVVGGYLLFEQTLVGTALRATADDAAGARLVGINVRRMRALAFQVAGLFGAAAGVLLAPLLPLGWAGIFPLAVIGSIGAIGGRWEYVPAALASLAVGLSASYAGGYLSTHWYDVYVYGVFVVILLFLREDRRAGTHRPLSRTRPRRAGLPTVRTESLP